MHDTGPGEDDHGNRRADTEPRDHPPDALGPAPDRNATASPARPPIQNAAAARWMMSSVIIGRGRLLRPGVPLEGEPGEGDDPGGRGQPAPWPGEDGMRRAKP